MSDEYWWADLIRTLVGASALLLAAVVFRFGWAQRGRPGKPHFGFYLSYVLAMVLVAVLRLTHVGQPPTWDLWVATAADVIGLWAAIHTWRLRLDPPHRR